MSAETLDAAASKKRKIDKIPERSTEITVSKEKKELCTRNNYYHHSMEGNPTYAKQLRISHEVGFLRPIARKIPSLHIAELEVNYICTAMTEVMKVSLVRRYQTHAALCHSEIISEVAEISALTADMCMSAIYSKLRKIHKSCNKYTTRFATSPTYTKDLELPLPFAVAIQELGLFESVSVTDNQLYVPIYPEGIQNEGRATSELGSYKYESYLPIIKAYGIPCKSVDTSIKSGTSWWTYKVETRNKTVDLCCSLPPSNYSDLSACVRLLFCHFINDECADVIKFAPDSKVYCTRLKEQRTGSNVRAFQALCDGLYDEEWSQSKV